MIDVCTFAYGRHQLTVRAGRYGNGRIALVLDEDNCSDGPRYATLSVNLPDEELAEDEFVVHHDIEDGLLKLLLTTPGLPFEDTGRKFEYGWTLMNPVLRLNADMMIRLGREAAHASR